MPTKAKIVTGAEIVADARRYLGVPYLFGGTNPAIGLDCSGLVYVVCRDLGIMSVPRTSEEQAAWGIPIDKAETGCLVLFTGSEQDPPPGHIGIVVMPGTMIEEPHTGLSCQITSYQTNGTGDNEFLGYRRIPATVSSPTGSASPLPVTTNKQNAAATVQAAMVAGGAVGFIFLGIIVLVGLLLIFLVLRSLGDLSWLTTLPLAENTVG